MHASRRRPSTARVIVAMLIALVAIARGGGAAIACESVAAALQGAQHGGGTEHLSMPQHEQPEHEGCDTPERVSECLLMPACAPAVSETAIDVGESLTPAATIVVHATKAPAPVDRAPEPPPPRA